MIYKLSITNFLPRDEEYLDYTDVFLENGFNYIISDLRSVSGSVIKNESDSELQIFYHILHVQEETTLHERFILLEEALNLMSKTKCHFEITKEYSLDNITVNMLIHYIKHDLYC